MTLTFRTAFERQPLVAGAARCLRSFLRPIRTLSYRTFRVLFFAAHQAVGARALYPNAVVFGFMLGFPLKGGPGCRRWTIGDDLNLNGI